MTKWNITYTTAGTGPLEIEAEDYVDVDGKWVDFINRDESGPNHKVLRLRASDVERIQRA